MEPKSLKAHAISEAPAILTADGLDPERPWSAAGPENPTVSANGITYHVGDVDVDGGVMAGTVDAKKAGVDLFHLDGFQIAGGMVSIALSPKGTLLSRTFSRAAASELFDARTGKPVGSVGARELALAPDESYAVTTPWLGPMTNALESTDLTILRFGAVPSKKVVASWKSIVKGEPSSAFGVAICPTGAVFAASHPAGELAVYRASDLAKLASSPKPAEGRPAFTRSGKWLVIHGDEGKVDALFELVP